LCGDDGLGAYAAEALADHYRDDPDVRVIASHQLTPEMSDDLAKSDFALPGRGRYRYSRPRYENAAVCK
jgi:Ni,Fe-hydrogenase maturation factor